MLSQSETTESTMSHGNRRQKKNLKHMAEGQELQYNQIVLSINQS